MLKTATLQSMQDGVWKDIGEAMSRLVKLEQRLRRESRSSLKSDRASRVQGSEIAGTHPSQLQTRSCRLYNVCNGSWLGG